MNSPHQLRKQRLRELCGVPVFRQALLHEAENLAVDAKLDGVTDLQLVVQDFAKVSSHEMVKLAKAAINGSVPELERLLEQRFDPDIAVISAQHDATVQLDTPLSRASDRGHVEIVRLLLEAGAGTNGFCEESQLPLVRACRRGHLTFVRMLLAANADVDRMGFCSRPGTGLRYHMRVPNLSGGSSVVKQRLLVKARAVIDKTASGFEEGTPLRAACAGGHMETAQLLLEMRADIHKGTNDLTGGTPLHAAAGSRSFFSVLLLTLGSREQVCLVLLYNTVP